MGNALFNARRYPAAIKQLRQVVQAQPTHDAASSLLGLAYREQGDYDKASQLLRVAAQLQPTNANYWFELGVAHYYAFELDRAREAMERSIALDPHNNDVIASLYHLRQMVHCPGAHRPRLVERGHRVVALAMLVC